MDWKISYDYDSTLRCEQKNQVTDELIIYINYACGTEPFVFVI